MASYQSTSTDYLSLFPFFTLLGTSGVANFSITPGNVKALGSLMARVVSDSGMHYGSLYHLLGLQL